MTAEASHSEPVVARSPRRWRRTLAIVLSVAVVLIGIPGVVAEITPRPFALLLRAGVGMIDDSVTIGPYADRLEAVTASEEIAVAVEGLPDARLTFYFDGLESSEPKPVVLLIHGGGWILGTAAQIATYAQLLASEGYLVANLDYSLAPEHPYPTPVLQSMAALDYLAANAARFGGDSTRLFVGGNSAGAQLASQVGALVTNSALRAEMGVQTDVPASDLRGVFLFSGPYDFDTVAETNFPGFTTFAWSYLGEKNWTADARLDQLSATRSATAEYPATYLTTGDADPLEPQTYALEATLQSLGVHVTSRYFTGTGSELPHDYIYDLSTAAARTAFDDVTAFIDEHSK